MVHVEPPLDQKSSIYEVESSNLNFFSENAGANEIKSGINDT